MEKNRVNINSNRSLVLFFGKFSSLAIMVILFFAIITPIAFIIRILGKDLIKLKRNNNKTYWVLNSRTRSKMKNQY
jgi:hypothetical protein